MPTGRQIAKIATGTPRVAKRTRKAAYRILATPCAAWRLDARECDFLSKLAKFLVVGGTGVVVNSLVLFLLYDKVGLPLVAASVLAVEVAIINNFTLNNLWTFRAKRFLFSRLAKFNLVSLAGLGITTATLWVLTTELGLHYLGANLVGISLATAWNFGMNLFWTWGWGQ